VHKYAAFKVGAYTLDRLWIMPIKRLLADITIDFFHDFFAFPEPGDRCP
jgi:hypothetical protein